MENKLHQHPAETTTTPAIARLDCEFTKHFLKSCLNQLKKLDGPSKIGKFIGDSFDIASGVTTAVSGEKAGRAVELSNTVITPFDRIAQEKKKIHVISIISSNSSQKFHEEFCQLFIGLGVRAYLAYEVLLQNIFLKAGSGDTKKEDPLQAVQILGGFAGSRCFDHMINTGTKENLLEALTTKDTLLECISKFRSLCVEKLFYWTTVTNKKTKNSNSNKVLQLEREQKCISSYEFFFKTIPVFIDDKNTDSCEILSGKSKSCNAQLQLYIFPSDMNKMKKHRLRKPLDFEIKAQQFQYNKYTNLVLIPSKMIKAYKEFILPVKLKDFILYTNQLTKEIADLLKDDESLSWSDTMLNCIRDVMGIVGDIHRKISQHASVGFDSNEKASSNPKIRFNVRDPIESFTGREVYLKDLHKSIKDSRGAGTAMTVTVLSQTSVISGLGGIGKTETVRMYIHKYGTEYDHIVWIDAELHSTAEACFQKLASDKLMIKSQNHENKPKHFDTILDEIYHLLCQNGSILLLVFDNAEALYDNFEGSQNNGGRTRSLRTEGIQRFLPSSLPPHLTKPSILITSRLQDWGQQKKVIQLGLWTEAECTAFIMKQLQLEDNDTNSAESLELSQFFDRFPMALQSAVGVIRQQAKRKKLIGGSYRIPDLINDYSSGKGKRDVLKKQPLDSSSNKTTMFLIWNVTLDKIRGDGVPGELAIKILNTMAYLSPTVIPKCLICHLFKEDVETLADALELLSDYSLIEASKDQFTIHRMIQDVTMEQLRATDADADIDNNGPGHCLKEMEILLRLTNQLKEYLPCLLQSDPTYDYILTNMIHVADIVSSIFISKGPVVAVAVVEVEEFQRFVEYLADQIKKTRSDLAQKYYEILIQSSSSCILHFDEDMQKVRQAYQLKLAGILRWQGKYSQAQEKLAQILEEQEEAWGLEDPATLTTKHKIAYVLSDQGKFREALEMYQAVLKTREKISRTASIDDAAPYCYDNDTFKTKHNMALVLNNQGDYQNALKIFNEVLQVRIRELGDDKYDTLKTKRDMAGVLNNIGDYEDAIRMYTEVENIWEKELGLTNPDVIKTKHNKALVLLNQEKYEDALQIFLQVFEIRKQDLGLCHPETLKTKECVADVLRSQGKRDEALKLYSEVLKIRKDLLGSSHPHTLTTKQSVDSLQCKKYWLKSIG